MVNIVIGSGKYSAAIIERRREFGLCIATEDLMEKVDICGYTHGDRVDKFELVKLTRYPAERIDLSLIKECPVCLECAVREVIGGKTHDIFLAEIICTHVDERFIKKNGDIDLKEMNILSYVDGKYWTMGNQLAKLYYSRRG
jgi:flavin reductase (DIM6/NTAB) family NADH-FMN oxidoreductase RutF